MIHKHNILKLRSEGKTYKEISETLGCSKGTISFHCSKLENNQDIIESRYEKNNIFENCLSCKGEIKVKRKGKKFCQSKCKNLYNAKKYYLLNGMRYINCKCGKEMHPQSKLCKACRKETYHNLTIGDLKKKYDNKNIKNWWSSEARSFARMWNPKILNSPCKSCGYEKHVEVCHITPISVFPDETKLSVVNSPDNLVGLCPNCHWEFDNELLTLEEITNQE